MKSKYFLKIFVIEFIFILNKDKYKTFRVIWKLIVNKPDIDVSALNNIKPDSDFFVEIPVFQHFLTDENKIFNFPIDYKRYSPLTFDEINSKDISKRFTGILNYIFIESGRMLNTYEIEFHFSGAKNRKCLKQMYDEVKTVKTDDINILNIFEYENKASEFLINCIKHSFFGIKFNNIKMKPYAYSIGSGISLRFNRLVSFTFEGYNDKLKKWEILDERKNINDLIPNGGSGIFYVHLTKTYYSAFLIRQTEPAANGFWGFSIAAFDIHGDIIETDHVNNDDFNFDLTENLSLSFDIDF